MQSLVQLQDRTCKDIIAVQYSILTKTSSFISLFAEDEMPKLFICMYHRAMAQWLRMPDWVPVRRPECTLQVVYTLHHIFRKCQGTSGSINAGESKVTVVCVHMDHALLITPHCLASLCRPLCCWSSQWFCAIQPLLLILMTSSPGNPHKSTILSATITTTLAKKIRHVVFFFSIQCNFQ